LTAFTLVAWPGLSVAPFILTKTVPYTVFVKQLVRIQDGFVRSINKRLGQQARFRNKRNGVVRRKST
jgi:hypothetical protein